MRPAGGDRINHGRFSRLHVGRSDQEKGDAVLCVEDRPDWLEALRGMLDRAGYEVVCATSGCEALDSFRSQEFDGVLLDYSLPDLDSLAIRAEMKHVKPQIPVLLFAGMGKSACMLLRFFDAYMHHPDSPESMLERMAS
jgi:DNA-binding response OmpR family regulator